MLTLLTKKFSRWATTALVVAYAFGLVIPTVAIALGDEASIVHSLTEDHGGLFTLHVHIGGKSGKHDKTTSPAQGHHCCGALSVAGLAPPATMTFVQPHCTVLTCDASRDGFTGRTPDRLDRPPRSSSSL